ncbi:TPA: PTS sugar transporter subunit IIB [Streptococcus mutans]
MKIFTICQSGLGTSFMVQMNIESALQDAGVDMENFTVEHTDSGSISGDMADYFFAEKTLVPALTNLPEEKIVALNSIIDAEEITENVLKILDANGIAHN